MSVPLLPAPSAAAQETGAWTDIQSLGALRRLANKNEQAALPAVAKQFEAVFTEMLIHSMRQASFQDPIFGGQQMKQWQSVFDHQIALTLANDGKGLGIATMLERQLGQGKGSTATTSRAALSSAERATRTIGGVRTGDQAKTPDSALPGWVAKGAKLVGELGSQAVQAAQSMVIAGPEDFVRKMAPYAEKAAHALGVTVRAVLAQAALETDWGQRMPQTPSGASSHNLFGVKAGSHWQGPRAVASTTEFEDGEPTRVDAPFRAYAGPAQSFADYTKILLGNSRYAAALGQGDDVAGFAQALSQGGYATDPSYASKLVAMANSPAMQQALAVLKIPGERPK